MPLSQLVYATEYNTISVSESMTFRCLIAIKRKHCILKFKNRWEVKGFLLKYRD